MTRVEDFSDEDNKIFLKWKAETWEQGYREKVKAELKKAEEKHMADWHKKFLSYAQEHKEYRKELEEKVKRGEVGDDWDDGVLRGVLKDIPEEYTIDDNT